MSGYSKQSVNISCYDNINNIIKSSQRPSSGSNSLGQKSTSCFLTNFLYPRHPQRVSPTHPHKLPALMSYSHSAGHPPLHITLNLLKGYQVGTMTCPRSHSKTRAETGLEANAAPRTSLKSLPPALAIPIDQPPNPHGCLHRIPMQIQLPAPPFQPDGQPQAPPL